MAQNSFLDKYKTDLDNVIDALELIKVRSDFIDPIMFQQISSSLEIDASDFDSLEESIRKSQEVPNALQASSDMIDDSLSKLEETEQAIAKLKDDLKAEKQRLCRLIDAS
jgi:DNA repair ATPase RecN